MNILTLFVLPTVAAFAHTHSHTHRHRHTQQCVPFSHKSVLHPEIVPSDLKDLQLNATFGPKRRVSHCLPLLTVECNGEEINNISSD